MTRRQADVASLHALPRRAVVCRPALVSGSRRGRRPAWWDTRRPIEAGVRSGGPSDRRGRGRRARARSPRGRGRRRPASPARRRWRHRMLTGSASSANSATSAARRGSPPAGGDQSTWTTGTPSASRSAAKRSSPTLTTRISPPSGPLAPAALEGFGNCGRTRFRRRVARRPGAMAGDARRGPRGLGVGWQHPGARRLQPIDLAAPAPGDRRRFPPRRRRSRASAVGPRLLSRADEGGRDVAGGIAGCAVAKDDVQEQDRDLGILSGSLDRLDSGRRVDHRDARVRP